MSELVALPTSSDASAWTPEEKALVEAAGLVHTDSQTGEKILAERPVVAAFLRHCERTGLDPIARQIYSIARKSKGQLRWQIQISIDGARLIAERSGQYEGQTTPQFTADGQSWTEVWLSTEFPKAARVGVYRRGFRKPLYAVALWDAYVQTTYNGDVTDMWRRMGPLMLAKCAETMALRKAFPQDLSGLYSAEEMSQADSGASSATPAAPSGAAEPHRAAAAAAEEVIVEAEVVDDRKPGEVVAEVLGRIGVTKTKRELRSIYKDAQAAGVLGVVIDESGMTVEGLLVEQADRLPESVKASE